MTRSTAKRAGKQGTVWWFTQKDMQEELCQGAMVSAQQKAMVSLNSAPPTTDTAAQAELRWEHAASPVPGCRVDPALVPVSAGSSEHSCGR